MLTHIFATGLVLTGLGTDALTGTAAIASAPSDAATAPLMAQQAKQAQPAPLRLALSFGDPVPLTDGEKAQIRFLLPGVDPEVFPPETWGKLRGVLLSDAYKIEKRNRLKWLMP